MVGKTVHTFEHYYSGRDLPGCEANRLKEVDEFISTFIDRRNQIVSDCAHLVACDGLIKEQVDLKAYMENFMGANGKRQPDYIYPFYRAVKRYAFSRHGESFIYRHMSIQGFYLDVMINYLRLPSDYGIDDLVEYVVGNSMIIKSIVEGAFPRGNLGYRAYSFMYQRVARSREYGDRITAVTGNQFGRGGKQSGMGGKYSA